MVDRPGAGPRPIFGRTTIGDLVLAQLVGVLVGVGATAAGLTLWPALGVSAGVALLLLIRVSKRSVIAWLATWWRYLRTRDYVLGQTLDFRAPGGRSFGLYWDGDHVSAVVEVLPPKGELTSITTEAFDTTHRLPITDLAHSLTQHDIHLSGIDIISHGYRSRSGTGAGAVYEQLIGPLPATAVRTVWLTVTFDSAACPDAVARRGGGREGASRAVTIAAQRIVRTLDDRGCRSRLLTASEIREAVLQVTGGADPRAVTQHWRHADLGDVVSTGRAIDPDRLGSDLLAKLWVAPSRGTTVAVRLRPGATPETVGVGAAWRLMSHTRPKPVKLRSTVSMNGRHRDAVLAHLPIAVAGTESAIPVREFPISDVDRLQLPSSGCGQLIGSDEQQQGIATRVVGTGISTVYLAGELYLAQQIVFRALAIGARVLVRTDRPHAWENLVTTIGNTDRLNVATEEHYSDAGYNATVVDGVLAPAPHAGVTTIYLTSHPSGWPQPTPDLAIHQPRGRGSYVVLRTGSAEVELSLVSIPRETAFIGRPRGARAMQEAQLPG